MELIINFRKIESTEAIKKLITKKVAKLDKFVNYPAHVHVMCSTENTLQTAELTLHAEHRDLVAMAKSKDLYESIDLGVKKLITQLKKEREKQKGHKQARALARAPKLPEEEDTSAGLPHRRKRTRG